jgi:hypothetical protein
MLASAQSKHFPSIDGTCNMNQTGAPEKKTEKMQIDMSHPRMASITAASLQVWLRAKKGNGRGRGEMRQHKVWNSNLVISITRSESGKVRKNMEWESQKRCQQGRHRGMDRRWCAVRDMQAKNGDLIAYHAWLTRQSRHLGNTVPRKRLRALRFPPHLMGQGSSRCTS